MGRGENNNIWPKIRDWLIKGACAELAFLAVILLAWARSGEAGVILAALLFLLVLHDVTELRLPDRLTLSLIVAGIAAACWMETASPSWRAASALTGYAALAGFATCYRALRGSEGLGMGDAKLFAGSGAWVGVEGLPLVLLCASVTALVCLVIARTQGVDISRTTRIPFGPYLALGTWLVWMHGAAERQ